MTIKKIRVAVLYGGRSGEHEVSLQSAASVVKKLDSNRFEIIPIGIDKQGQWVLNDINHLDHVNNSLPLLTSASELLPSPHHLTASTIDRAAFSKREGKFFDVVFPVLHGTLCEDGTIQGLLELMDIPYVGAGVLSSALGMDKDISKRLVAGAGLKVPPYLILKRATWEKNSSNFQKEIESKFGYPVFVKPANTGSSVGVHKVKEGKELHTAIQDAFLYDQKVVVEKAINAREVELSVLENLEFTASPLVSIPGEVVPSHEFYSYAAKYLDENGAELLIPAPLNQQQIKKAQELASSIFEILECEGMARVDLFLDKTTGEFIFNEINTLPGFTQISMYPKLWEASGLAYKDLLSYLIDLALARYERKQNLKRDWATIG